MKSFLKVFTVLALLAGIAGFAAYQYAAQLLDRAPALTQSITYRVPSHARFSQVAADLAARGVVDHPRLWIVYARCKGLAGQIKAGEYQILPGTSARKLLQQLVDGQVVLHALTIVDGWQLRDLLAALKDNHDIRATVLGSEAELMARLGSPGVAAEGQFLPETYKFPAGTTDFELLVMAHAALRKELDQSWMHRAGVLPLRNPQELLTLASIVEKETGIANERAKIAGVYTQRLLEGMRLQADPTVIYGLGERYDGNIHAADLRSDGPYNTYTRTGLPPGPIALAGAAAIRAAAHPEMTGALFFVASGLGDGSHTFSANLQAHNAAVALYLQRQRRDAKAPVLKP